MVQAKLSENLNPLELGRALASKDTAPLSNHTETVKPIQMPCPQSSGGLDPLSAGSKLEGYEPRFFLKEDGK